MSGELNYSKPTMKTIPTLHLFPVLDSKLIDLLKSLSKEDWNKQSIAPLWKVKDIAVHLLDGNIRTLSMLRDNYFGETPKNITSYHDMVQYLNRLNSDWIAAMKRVSPTVLIELLESTGKQYSDYLASLPPFEDATFSVGWAGETTSKNWFHIAREYTEKWHHQQQIRFAVGRDHELYSKELYFPYLETSMRALPHHYRNVKGLENDLIQFSIAGEGGGDWFLHFNGKQWSLVGTAISPPSCKVAIEGKIAWRIFTKGIDRTLAEKQVSIEGKIELGSKILDMIAVMA